jgi:hydrogenase maturation protease
MEMNRQDAHVRTIVLGIGNPLRGDDGIGVAIVEMLKELSLNSDDIAIVDTGISELDTLLWMQNYQRAFIIDAAEIGGEAGEWCCIQIDDISFNSNALSKCRSFHNSSLEDAIALGRVLGILPEEIFIYAIQPQMTQFSMGLSEPNSLAAKEVIEDLLSKLEPGMDIQ